MTRKITVSSSGNPCCHFSRLNSFRHRVTVTPRWLCRSQRYSVGPYYWGISWEDLPQSLSFGGRMTCWPRLRDWQAQNIWQQLHVTQLTQLHQAGNIDWSRASLDGTSVASPRGARKQDVTRQTEASGAVNIT